MTVSRRRWSVALVALAVLGASGVALDWLEPGLIRGAFGTGGSATTGPFQVAPYVQAGDGKTPGFALLWQTADVGASWAVEVRGAEDQAWAATPLPTIRRVAVEGLPPFRIYRAALPVPGKAGLTYRVLRAGWPAFTARVAPPPEAGAADRFVVFGDGAAASAGQKAVAYQAFRARPGYLVITGDIVYSRGRVSEYLDHFFPVYNHDDPGPGTGAPLLRSTVVYAAPGNHDMIEANLDKYPDGLAYFYYWDQPLNGPLGSAEAAGTPRLKGSDARRKAFLEAAGPAYPRMANFSFDRGDVHWTVLDANPYTDWTTPALRDWLVADLASPAAKAARWRLVAMHHPPFSSSKSHANDQRMRLLAPAFEAAGVAVVFAGHVHNYQRSHPLRFVPGPPPADGKGKPYGPGGQVDGRWTLDRTFDGVTRTRPDGVLYIVTGAGGARLYNPEQTDRPDSWRAFTARFVSNTHSLTVVDVTPDSLTLRQVAADGREVDRVVITQGPGS